MPYYNYNRPDAVASEGVREDYWRQDIATGVIAANQIIGAFSETDFCNDLRRITVPTLVARGGDDQIVPNAISGALTARLVRNTRLSVYEGAPHGLIVAHKDKLNAEFLDFLK